MKRKMISILAIIVLLLTGCSALGEANDTLSYANDASGYIDKAAEFAKEVPDLAKKAAKDEKAKEELKAKLEDMRKEIEAFAKLKAPEKAKELHQKILEKNAQLKEKIDIYLEQIDNGTFDEEVLKNEDLAKPIQEIKKIFEDIRNLANKAADK